MNLNTATTTTVPVVAPWRKAVAERIAPPAPAAAVVEPKGEPCARCKGTGDFIGYTGRRVGPCFSCEGRGYLLLTTAEREMQADAAADAFAAQHAEVIEWMRAKAPTFGFAASLLSSLSQYGKLTPNQLAAAERCMAEDKRRGTFGEAAKPVVQGFSGSFPVKRLHEVMQRHATFHAGDIVLSRRNGDQLVWIKCAGGIVGKIDYGIAVLFKAAGDQRERIAAVLRELDADPLAAAVRYGRESGVCCSCGRDLTDPVSIAAGIGPICREKFGI